MYPLFVCPAGKLRERWREAFPGARVQAALPDPTDTVLATTDAIWLDLGGDRGQRRADAVAAAVSLGPPVIAMAGVPTEADAFALLQAGARGYCHVEAAPEQLGEIALAVGHGGLWMPPELTRRFLGLALETVPPPQQQLALNELTSREVMVAEQVARGASNREIAAALDISERTVKAHLTAIFEKLGVRDRVQLALAMNNVPTYSTVN